MSFNDDKMMRFRTIKGVVFLENLQATIYFGSAFCLFCRGVRLWRLKEIICILLSVMSGKSLYRNVQDKIYMLKMIRLSPHAICFIRMCS